jgi:thioredoxin 1
MSKNLIHLDHSNFEKEINDSKAPLVIDFWAPWCGPCRMMGPVFEELSSEYSGKLKFAKLNTEEHPELAEKFDIRGIPTLVLVKKGREMNRLVGFRQKEELREELDSMIA